MLLNSFLNANTANAAIWLPLASTDMALVPNHTIQRTVNIYMRSADHWPDNGYQTVPSSSVTWDGIVSREYGRNQLGLAYKE